MDQQLLWIVAVIGASTLAGTFVKMQGGFGPMNLRAIGIVLIAVLATLLAIAKLDNITAAMGILGAIAGYLFGAEAKETPEPAASSAVDAAGATIRDNAKVAGRDINETVNKVERMLGDLQGLTSATIQNMQVLSDRVARRSIVQGRTERFEWQPHDPSVITLLQALSRDRPDDWTQRWVDVCLSEPDCIATIQRVVASLAVSRWEPRRIDFDNTRDGLHVNLEFEREFQLQAATD